MDRWRTILGLAGWILLCFASFILELRVKAAKTKNATYTSPLNGMIEDVPPPLRMYQYFLWAAFAAILAIGSVERGDYFFAAPWIAHVAIALYSSWVYRRGREPRIMEGFRELPDPPSLLKPK